MGILAAETEYDINKANGENHPKIIAFVQRDKMLHKNGLKPNK